MDADDVHGAEGDPLRGDTRALLRERIESYEELEMLLALERVRGDSKTAEELSNTVRVPVPFVEQAVRKLEAHGLIERRDGTARDRRDARYTYAPASADLDAAVRALAKAYAQQPIPIIKLMSENAIQRLRSGAARAFADAFILRKDK